jgi:hypothetical protein
MKKGFGDAGIPAEQTALFEGLPPRVINGLAQGFGVDVVKNFQQQANTLTAADFAPLGPDVCAELESILAMLREIV